MKTFVFTICTLFVFLTYGCASTQERACMAEKLPQCLEIDANGERDHCLQDAASECVNVFSVLF